MKSVFDSIEIGGLKAPNRVIRSATNDYLGNLDGTVSDAQIEMYDQLARNNVGTIITGHLSVAPELNQRADTVQLSVGDDSKIEGLKRIADKIHEYGGIAVAQISHAGKRAIKPLDFNSIPEEEIRAIIDMFVKAAVRVRKAGFDAVQIHAAHWYLLASVLNSDLNRRTDSFGGSDENRIRMVREIAEGIRRECGSDLLIFVKINAHNTKSGTDDQDQLVYYSRVLKDSGIDLLEISDMSFSKQPKDAECYFLNSAEYVKSNIPELIVSLVGGIYSESTISRALEVTDMVSMARTLLTQPDFITKLKNKELEKSRCIRCNKCFEIYKTKFERCIFGPVNLKLEETFKK